MTVNDADGDSMTTAVRTVIITNRHGLHARPAAEFVKLAAGFSSVVTVSKDGLDVNGKSIMGVMMLAAECGSELNIRAEGEDSAELVDALCALVHEGFGEDREEGSGAGAGGKETE